MTVLDLIIKLQQLPPDAQVLLDVSTDDMEMFSLGEIQFVDEFIFDDDTRAVVISEIDYNEPLPDDDESNYPFNLN